MPGRMLHVVLRTTRVSILCSKTQTLALDVLGDHRGVLLLEVSVEHLAKLLLGRFEELLILPRTCLAGTMRALRQRPGNGLGRLG